MDRFLQGSYKVVKPGGRANTVEGQETRLMKCLRVMDHITTVLRGAVAFVTEGGRSKILQNPIPNKSDPEYLPETPTVPLKTRRGAQKRLGVEGGRYLKAKP